MAIYSDFSVLIFDFNNETTSFIMDYKINKNEFEDILDVMIDSDARGLEGNYRCDVACKKKGETSVYVWTLNTLK